jgi:hypothetical protein
MLRPGLPGRQHQSIFFLLRLHSSAMVVAGRKRLRARWGRGKKTARDAAREVQRRSFVLSGVVEGMLRPGLPGRQHQSIFSRFFPFLG